MLARLPHAKSQKLACTHIIAHNVGMHMWASGHTRHTRDALYELTAVLPHYTCDVATGTVAVDNEM